MFQLLPGKEKGKSIHWYLFGTLLALELLMSFSFLGYIHVSPISITTAYIPVLLAGALLGPFESSMLGMVFGLASMWKASASYVMAADQLFSPVMSGHPLQSVLLSIGARFLFGLLTGLLYAAARKGRHPGLWIGVVSYLGRFLHAFLVYCALWVFFPDAGYTPGSALQDLVGADSIATNLFSAGLVLLFWYINRSKLWQQFQFRLEAARSFQLRERYHLWSLLGMIAVVLCSAVAVALYFVHRMRTVFAQWGIILSGTGYADLVHLQIQFLIGILSLMALVIIFLLFNRWYTTYMDREAKTDPLTGAMNRRAFFQSCAKALENFQFEENASGYFIMVDLDWFKEINDQYGHPEGDRALKESVLALRDIFGKDGLIGRVGGDEFALLLYTPVTRDELEIRLQHVQARIHNIRWTGHRMSCSIGALPIARSQSVEKLYRDADTLLYIAKEQGRDCHIIGPLKEYFPSPAVR